MAETGFTSLTQYFEAGDRARAFLGWKTQRQVAREAGISEAHLSLIVAGKRRPSPEVARRLSATTGIPLDRLLPPDEPATSEAVA